jgi:patatin-like phospholipase/acyl hydrolase
MMGKKKLLGSLLVLLCVGLIFMISARYHHSTEPVSEVDFSPETALTPFPECNATLVTVLSIDGGGVRGIIPAFLLNKIEQDTHLHIANLFDFMTGVSTGTILVAGLTTPIETGGPKYTAEEIIRFYQHQSENVFSASLLHRIFTLGGLIGPKYESTGMQQLTQQYFGDTTMSKLLSHVVLFGYDLKNKGLIAFSNHGIHEVNMPYYKIRDVIDGTTAIMSYFSSKSLYDLHKKVRHTVADASLVLNNPTAMAFLYAQTLCPNAEHYLVVSLGTGQYPAVNIQPKGWGLLRLLPDMLVTTIEGETATANLIMEKIAAIMNTKDINASTPKVLFIRINPEIGWERVNPVDGSAQNLSALATIAEQYYVKNKSLFHCLYPVLTNHSLENISRSCLEMLKKEHRDKTPSYF